MLRAIDPLSAPVTLVVVTVTVQVAEGEPPTAAAVEITGVPVMFEVVSEKRLVVTPVTGSLNVTVQCSGPAFVGLVSARLMEDTVGGVLSIVSTSRVAIP